MEASTARRRSVRRKAATTLTEIPDHLLAEIFLRLPAAEDLARASAVCVSFRRLVKDKSFLRGFRRLHRRAATVLHSSTPMATSTARRRHGRKKTKTTLTEIPDHLLAEIFLLLPVTEDLARVSAACVSFRRLAKDGSFLRRFRRLHAPPVLGFFDRDGFHPAVPPHPSAPAARALSLAGDFTFSFLPSSRRWGVRDGFHLASPRRTGCPCPPRRVPLRWAVRDVRDGRVLLEHEAEQGGVLNELVVCDPLHRRYILLPPLPDDLAASMEDPVHIFCEPSLIPPIEDDEDGAAQETAFRVIWSVCCKIKVYIFVFSSGTGQWRAAASQGLSHLLLAKGESTMTTLWYGMWRRYACGCVYWELMTKNDSWNVLLVLDTQRMELSIADLLPKGWSVGGLGIVEAGGDKLWTFRIIIDEIEGNDLSFTIAGSRGLSSTQWQAEKTISLDSEYRYCILAATGRYMLLESRGFGPVRDGLGYKEYFSLDSETLQLDRLWGNRRPMWPGTQRPFLYTNFPPSLLSSPRV